MTDTFRPNPFGAVLVSALVLGVGNAVLVAATAGAASLLVSDARITLGQLTRFAVVTGLGTSVAIAVADRPMTYRLRTDNPYGATVTFAHLALPLLVGGLCGWFICGSRWFFTGAICAFLAYLVQFFLLAPWKKTVDDEKQKAQSKEFAKVTRRYVEEYKAELGEITRQKAQRKHEKNQERLRKQRERS